MARADDGLANALFLVTIPVLAGISFTKAHKPAQHLHVLHDQQRVKRHRLARTIRRLADFKSAARMSAEITVASGVDEKEPPGIRVPQPLHRHEGRAVGFC